MGKQTSWHVERTDSPRHAKRVLEAPNYADRRQGRPRRPWIDDLEADLKKLKGIGWKSKAKVKVKDAITQLGL